MELAEIAAEITRLRTGVEITHGKVAAALAVSGRVQEERRLALAESLGRAGALDAEGSTRTR